MSSGPQEPGYVRHDEGQRLASANPLRGQRFDLDQFHRTKSLRTCKAPMKIGFHTDAINSTYWSFHKCLE